jgi:hypothetical protein
MSENDRRAFAVLLVVEVDAVDWCEGHGRIVTGRGAGPQQSTIVDKK